MTARMALAVACGRCGMVNLASRLASQHVAAEPLPLAILIAPHPGWVGAIGPVVPPVVVAIGRPAAVVVQRPFAAIPVHHHVAAAAVDAAAIAVAVVAARVAAEARRAAEPVGGRRGSPD